MIPPTLPPALTLLSHVPQEKAESMSPATNEQNQQQLLNNQSRILNLTSRYIDELESRPVGMESVQILGGLSMATGLSDSYIDYLA